MISFEYPSGLAFAADTQQSLLLILAGMSDADWQRGSGMATLSCAKTGRWLALVKRQGEPHYMLTTGENGGWQIFVHAPDAITSELVEVYIGGDPISYPASFFHDPDRIAAILDDFARSGTVELTDGWPPLHLQEWHGME